MFGFGCYVLLGKKEADIPLCVKNPRQATYMQEQTQEYALSHKLLYIQQH